MPGPRKSHHAGELAQRLKNVAKTRPDQLYAELFRIFLLFAGAGDSSRASHVLSWMYGPRVPAPKAIPSVWSTFAIDGFCAAAGLGERTQGLRRVSCEYAQVHLEPASLDDVEQQQVYFQEDGDSERGMSLFPTMVGIGTPKDTDYVDAQISLAKRVPGAADWEGAAQVVTFPLTVRGPLVLRSVAGNDDDPLLVPPGAYDVLARFSPKKAPRASEASGLRVFSLTLSFHPQGALGAPQTICLEGTDGDT